MVCNECLHFHWATIQTSMHGHHSTTVPSQQSPSVWIISLLVIHVLPCHHNAQGITGYVENKLSKEVQMLHNFLSYTCIFYVYVQSKKLFL